MKIVAVVSGSARNNFSYRMVRLCAELHRRGHDTALIAPSADKYNNFTPEAVGEIDGVRIVQPFQFTTKNAMFNLVPYLFSASWAVLCSRADVVYIYKPTPVSIVGLLARLRRKTTVILDMDDLGSEVMKLEGRSALECRLVARSEHLAERWSHGITAASSYLVTTYQTRYPGKPVLRVPNAAESSWFSGTPTAPKIVRKHLVFLGSIDRLSIMEPLLDALPEIVRKHPDVRVTIIGDGPHAQHCKDRVHQAGLDTHVTFTGWLQLSEARKLQQPGDLGYAYMPNEPTVLAASIMKVPQYMALGVVPVVSNIGDLPEMVGRGEGGYVCEHSDPQALADTIAAALNDPERAAKAAAAQRIVKTSMNWTGLAEKVNAWMQELRT